MSSFRMASFCEPHANAVHPLSGPEPEESLLPTTPGPIIALIGIAIAVVGWCSRKSQGTSAITSSERHRAESRWAV